ncbi:outer membrane beta-barrel protein [Parabacteroides goldsteinii]|uniref:TonB-dependent receptor n=1 Tax=Parabacteroides goldsteinii TaxID=328812 RepID=UPI001CCB813F|nr:TonB-dependent receptor [Parabacteroides goldsteinii]UBD73719.1 outer membrane beta-barrel protein [Parabacteroides goldsteinii]
MKRILFAIMLLGCMIQGVFAQNLEIKGMVRNGRDKAPLEFANVVLQTADSVFITGTTTDGKGRFMLDKVKAGDYLLAVSSLGYETQYIALDGFNKSIDLKEILMEDAPVSLDGVTVSASNTSSRSDRKLIFPSDRQVKASTNGMDLLQQLMLPKITVNPMSNEIKVPGDGEVQLRINGVKVELDEIKALLPADIIRIEFHDNPGLRYRNAEVVLDYIVRRPETGGNFSVDMSQGVNALWGEHRVSGKINHKKSEFGASYRIGPRDFYGMSRDNEEIFHLADGTVLHRKETGDPSHASMFMHNLNLNYSVQDPEKYLFNATFRYWNNHQPHWDYRGILSNLDNPDDYVDMVDLNSSDNQVPALDLYYQRNLKNDQTLVFNVVGTYNRTSSHRFYQESRGEELLTDINNRVSGKKYSLIGEAIYEKKLANGNSLSGGVWHTQSFSDNEYRNGHDYDTHMDQSASSIYGEFKGKVRKLDYMLGVELARLYYKQEGTDDSDQFYTFNPRFTLQYALPGQSFIRLKGYVGNLSPSLGNLNAVEQVIDSLQLQRGNPRLESYMSYLLDLNYEYQKGIFYALVNGTYEYVPNAIMDEKYQEGNKIIQTWNNQKNWQRVVGSAMFRVGPIKDILQFSFTGGVNHYISNGNTYSHRYTNWYCNMQASLTWKKFMLMYQMNTNWNRFWGETLEGGENIQMFMAKYNFKNLSLGIGAFNPFSDNWKVQSENWNQYASSKKTSYIKESSRLFVVSVSYNFSFGRTYKAGQKRLNNSDSDSGVMSTGK